MNTGIQLLSSLLHIAEACIHHTSQILNLICQLFHLGRYHGKSLSLSACPGCLNGSIQSQNIGLVCNGNDLAHTAFDLLHGSLQILKGSIHLHKMIFHLHGAAL